MQPSSWNLLIDGKLAGKTLLLVAPEKFAQATGVARIDGSLALTGHGVLPLINGRIAFDPAAGEVARPPLAFTPRGVRHELAVLGGIVDIKTTANGSHRTYTATVSDDDALTVAIDATASSNTSAVTSCC